MIETIGDRLADVLSEFIAIARDQDGTERMPYAVYSLDIAPGYVKGGIYKYSGTMYIYVYAANADAADTLMDQVISAIGTSMQDDVYRSRLMSASSNDDNGRFVRTLEYSISQFNKQ